MSRVVVSLPPDAAWQTALSSMREHHVHHIPVVDGGRMVGMIRQSDIQRAAMIEGQQQAGGVSLARVMVRKVHPVAPCALLTEALDQMLMHHVSILPVVEDGRLVGVVTHTDLLRLLSSSVGSSQDALYLRIKPSDRLGGVLGHYQRRLQHVTVLTNGDIMLVLRMAHGQAESDRVVDQLQVDWKLDVIDATYRPGRAVQSLSGAA
jgi:acetoin utilization protein AcuB